MLQLEKRISSFFYTQNHYYENKNLNNSVFKYLKKRILTKNYYSKFIHPVLVKFFSETLFL